MTLSEKQGDLTEGKQLAGARYQLTPGRDHPGWGRAGKMCLVL